MSTSDLPGPDTVPHREVDYFSKGDAYLSSARVFRAGPNLGSRYVQQSFGSGWFGKWDKSINLVDDGKAAHVARGDGTVDVYIRDANGQWKSSRRDAGSLSRLSNGGAETSIWVLKKGNSQELYNEEGRLLRIEIKGGRSYDLEYSSGSVAQLVSVTDNFGRQLKFSYDAEGRVSDMSDPSGQTTRFSYNDSSQLVQVSYADGTKVNLRYANEQSTLVLASSLRSPAQIEASLGTLSNLPNILDLEVDAEKQNALSRVSSTSANPKNSSCPVPCQPWMRAEISACKNTADQIRTQDEYACYTTKTQDDQYCFDAFFTTNITNFNNCLAASETKYNACIGNAILRQSDRYRACEALYPQCS